VALSAGRHSKAAVAADINVTPMIDVMLVLLIIFMIVTPAITAGIQATIPRATNPESREEAEGEIRLGIDKDGKYFLDITNPVTGHYTGMRFVNDADLEARLRELYSRRTVDKILYLKADENLEYQRVQDAVELARRAGVRVIGAISDQKQQRRRSGEH
jgi:biopolymer transport protein ExbD